MIDLNYVLEVVMGYTYFDIYFDMTYEEEATEYYLLCEVANLIIKDGYDIKGFELCERPHKDVFCFFNEETKESFDIINDITNGKNNLFFSYLNNFCNYKADSMKEAIDKFMY